MAASVVPQCQVFLNFRGEELRHNFISHLEKALKDKNINVFIDEKAAKGQDLDFLFKEIQKSRLALVIFSENYTESPWCLNELVEIKNCMKDGKLLTIPIFYKLDPTTVKHQEGAFGDKLRGNKRCDDDQKNKWIEALVSVCNVTGFTFHGKSSENEFIGKIVEEVLETLISISSDGSKIRSLDLSKDTEVTSGKAMTETFRLTQANSVYIPTGPPNSVYLPRRPRNSASFRRGISGLGSILGRWIFGFPDLVS